MIQPLALAGSLFAMGLAGQAQDPHFAFAPPAPGIIVAPDVQYGTSGATRLAMDLYTPAGPSSTRRTALVFFNRAVGAERSDQFYASWARAAASKGIIGILPDLRAGSEAADFKLLMTYLEQHGAEHGIDAIAVYAASGNAYAGFQAVEDPAQKAVKAAVIYYGSAPIARFRLDLPVLYVRAGLDRRAMNEGIESAAALAIAQNAPLTLLNYAGGHHAFELADDNDATRDVIAATLDFVTRATSAPYQAALHASVGEASAAGFMRTQRFPEAVAEYGRMVAARPDDPRLRLSYGEALLGDAQYAAACAEFDKLRNKDLGYRDLGLPAARACLLKGEPETAIAWLRSIPPQFLPAAIATDPEFAKMRDRADFQALFTRK